MLFINENSCSRNANAGYVRCICNKGPQVMKFEPAPVVRPNLVDRINWVPLYSGHLGACLHGGGGPR